MQSALKLLGIKVHKRSTHQFNLSQRKQHNSDYFQISYQIFWDDVVFFFFGFSLDSVELLSHVLFKFSAALIKNEEPNEGRSLIIIY